MSFYTYFVKGISPLVKIYHRLEIFGQENIPPEGKGFIITPNHTNWFGWDGIVISSVLKDREISWVSWSYENANPLWDMAVKMFNGILYNNKKKFLYQEVCDKILQKGNIVGIFPEGNNNTINKWYRLRPFFPGCIRLSIMADVPIIPVAVAGLEEASPILWAKEKEKEPISFLLSLPIVFPTNVKIHFGKPVYPKINKKQLHNRSVLFNAAKEIQTEVLKLLKKYRPKAYAE